MKKFALLALVALVATSCAIVPSDNGVAIIGNTKEAVSATAVAGSRTGKACATNYLGLVVVGDSSIDTAKKNGGITRVSSVDREVNRMVIMATNCTVVKGN